MNFSQLDRECESQPNKPRYTETDSVEFSSLKKNSDQAHSFFQMTTKYIQNSLGVDTNASVSELSSDPIIASFGPIGEAIVKAYSKRKYNLLIDLRDSLTKS